MNSMKVGHLCSSFVGSRLYTRLFESLDKKISGQQVYIPVRNKGLVGFNSSESLDSILMYRNIIKPYHRYFYKKKIKLFLEDYLKTYSKEDVDSIDCYHAHTLFTDGGLAYELHKLTGKPYVVAVRNTDVNLFLKYALHLRLYVKKIINSAHKVIFISPSMESIFFQYLNRSEINNTCVIPNGIDSFWFSSSETCAGESVNNSPRILFVGNIDSNKNPLLLLNSFERIQAVYPEAKIKIVGPAGNQFEKVGEKSLVNDGVIIVGKVESKEKLKDLYQWANVFAMVSHRETFGLVYVEALSQGVPLVYSRGQGFDQFFNDGEVGFSCDSRSITEITATILNVFEHEYLDQDLVTAAASFTWGNISERYLSLYKEMAV